MSIGQEPHKQGQNPDSHPQFHNLESWSKNLTRSQGWEEDKIEPAVTGVIPVAACFHGHAPPD
jgi:hypothetical protein